MATIGDVNGFLPESNGGVSGYEGGVFKLKIRNFEVLLPEEHCDKFLLIKDTIINTSETGMFLPGYFEQFLEVQGYNFIAMPRLFRGDEREIIIMSPDETAKMEVSSLSYPYILRHLSNSGFYNLLGRNNISMVRRAREGDGEVSLCNICERFLSIKVTVQEGHRFYNNKEQLKRLAEAGLFHISYNVGGALGLANSWEKSYYRLTKRRNRDFQFPQRTYDKDLLAYYQLALSSDSLILSYIGLYKILEHFFFSATEKVLHKRVSELLVSPDFTHKKAAKLRQLTSLVRKFDQKTNEQQMLTTVLETYFMIDEIVGWVRDYEQENGDYYTVSRTFLDTTYILDTNPQQLYSSLAKRIYSIRNALVHSKEGEMPRYIPFSGQEEFIAKELPILLFLAENLIIKTGIDI